MAIYALTLGGQLVSFQRRGTGKPVLFLHGGRVQARTFEKFLKILTEQYEVIAPDIPGYGSSPTPKTTWSFENYAVFFDDFLERLQLTDVTVVGYSMGGGIALNLAARSKRISKLVLVDASGLTVHGVKGSHYDIRRLWFYLSHPQYMAALFVLFRDYSAFLWSHRKDYRQLRLIRNTCRQTSYSEAFRRIIVPTSIVWGERDWIYPTPIAYEYQRRIPHSDLYFVPGNHDWLVYNPLLLKECMI